LRIARSTRTPGPTTRRSTLLPRPQNHRVSLTTTKACARPMSWPVRPRPASRQRQYRTGQRLPEGRPRCLCRETAFSR
jgi:hypothetical protein